MGGTILRRGVDGTQQPRISNSGALGSAAETDETFHLFCSVCAWTSARLTTSLRDATVTVKRCCSCTAGSCRGVRLMRINGMPRFLHVSQGTRARAIS